LSFAKIKINIAIAGGRAMALLKQLVMTLVAAMLLAGAMPQAVFAHVHSYPTAGMPHHHHGMVASTGHHHDCDTATANSAPSDCPCAACCAVPVVTFADKIVVAVVFKWMPVAYRETASRLTGITIPPDPIPPIVLI
jgi:hypothetical protein